MAELSVLSKLLDVTSLRHRAIAHNISNLNTADFKEQKVEFEKLLDQENLQEDILQTAPKLLKEENATRIDGNSTSLDTQMQSLMQNHMEHQVYLRAVSHHLNGIKSVISGRSS